MRGRAKDPVAQRAKSSRHAKRAHCCSCGKIVHGNGGKTAHAAMHERRGEWHKPFIADSGYTYISADAHRAKFPQTWT